MLKNIKKVWEVLKKYDIRPVTVQIEDFRNVRMIKGEFPKEGESTQMGSPFQFMFSPPFLGFIANINRVMAFYPQIIKDFHINAKPIDLKIIYDRQVFLIFLINSLEVYLSSTFILTTDILRVDNPKSELIIKFIKKYGSIEKYNEFYKDEYKPEFVSKFLTKRIYFQQKDACRECFKFININLFELDPKLWQKIFSKNDSYMDLRHKIIHGGRPAVKEINEIFGINYLENALIDIVRFVYLIEEQRFLKYKRIEENSDFLQSLKNDKK